jgi:hypothetical protein
MQYLIYTDPDTGLNFREGAIGSEFVIDNEWEVDGFSGLEDFTWGNLETLTPQ